MSSSNSPTMHRSISMPAQPQPLQTKPMKRSQEKETLVEEDYYPESPNTERRKKSVSDNRDRLGSCTQSANFITTEWAGSTIELNTDLRRNEVDTFYHHRKPYRVIEKSGRENVTFKKIPEKSWRYIRDFVTTLVRWILPNRYLTETASPPSTSVNNTQSQTFKSADKDEALASVNKMLEDTVETKEIRDDNEISDDNTIRDTKISDNKNNDNQLEISERKRVIFSLYD